MALGFADTQTNRIAVITMKAFKQFQFDAAHQLPDWPGIHGHSYTAEVWFEGDAADGYVLTESALTRALEPIRAMLDHSNLNDLIELPTSENIARFVWARLAHMNGLYRVRILRGSIGFGIEYDREDALRDNIQPILSAD